MTIKADVILDLQRGDTGKGATAYHLSKTGGYTHCMRFNGSNNAGHTVYHNGQKVVTHAVPVGILHGITSVIGRGCVINPVKLREEIEYLAGFGIDVGNLLKIDKHAHIIRPDHIEEDSRDVAIGTTRQGNGPAYSDKYKRSGKRMSELDQVHGADILAYFQPYFIDTYDYFYETPGDKTILFEGAQGFYLDVDWGEYPYVTSSHCGIGSVFLNGFNPSQIRRVYGVMKAYETYVGAKQFESDMRDLTEIIVREGQEYGATTGRRRQVNWMRLEEVVKAIKINGVTDLIIRKKDVLDKTGKYPLYDLWDEVKVLGSSDEFKGFVETHLSSHVNSIHWSPGANSL